MTGWPEVTRDCKRCGRPFTQVLKQGHPYLKCEVCRDPPPRPRRETTTGGRARQELGAEGSKDGGSPSPPRRAEPLTPASRLRRLRRLRERLEPHRHYNNQVNEVYKKVCARIVEIEAGPDPGIASTAVGEIRQLAGMEEE